MFEDDPEVWFEGLETQFAIRKITKPETKLESGLAMVDNYSRRVPSLAKHSSEKSSEHLAKMAEIDL